MGGFGRYAKMISIEDFKLICDVLAILGILSWVSGPRSLFFGKIELRKEPFWIALRWFGFGIWVAKTSVSPDEWVLHAIAATCLCVGSIWKKSEVRSSEPKDA